jgi:hypothetical protein
VSLGRCWPTKEISYIESKRLARIVTASKELQPDITRCSWKGSACLGFNGTIGTYLWAEFWNEEPELSLSAVVRGLSRFLIGTNAVNVSWDSGRLVPSEQQFASGWSTVDGYTVTPPIDERLIHEWPRSSCSFDEWYFFWSVPKELNVLAFCNWLSSSLADWESLTFKFDLSEQLRRLQPIIVLGEGYSIFVIARDHNVIEEFGRLAHEREV